MFGFLRRFRRRHAKMVQADPALDEARRQVEQLEARASYAVPQVIEHGERNHFAERLRRTIPHPGGA